jgi:hypothetical protein
LTLRLKLMEEASLKYLVGQDISPMLEILRNVGRALGYSEPSLLCCPVERFGEAVGGRLIVPDALARQRETKFRGTSQGDVGASH